METVKPHNTREKILIEALKLVQREGFTRLTIERVAKEADLSKGGLLYHFPSKEKLEEGMIEYVMEKSNMNLEKKLSVEEDTPGRWLRGYAKAMFEEAGLQELTSPGLLATMISNPAFVDSWRKEYKKWHENVRTDSQDVLLGTIIFLAIDGLWYADLLDLNPPKGEFRQQLFEALLKLIKLDSTKNFLDLIE
ncbi:TetR/AcrR family transcriptional regulator [Siminovitchia sediminis]|uniref:TetR/AcrR family transcriptional regulator n=1 Tax=Siminovitchia sediminis TaxID=1274353 RepID=A0ABW4KL91_9BACI